MRFGLSSSCADRQRRVAGWCTLATLDNAIQCAGKGGRPLRGRAHARDSPPCNIATTVTTRQPWHVGGVSQVMLCAKWTTSRYEVTSAITFLFVPPTSFFFLIFFSLRLADILYKKEKQSKREADSLEYFIFLMKRKKNEKVMFHNFLQHEPV